MICQNSQIITIVLVFLLSALSSCRSDCEADKNNVSYLGLEKQDISWRQDLIRNWIGKARTDLETIEKLINLDEGDEHKEDRVHLIAAMHLSNSMARTVSRIEMQLKAKIDEDDQSRSARESTDID